jgi:hypothetical protein
MERDEEYLQAGRVRWDAVVLAAAAGLIFIALLARA